MDSKQRPFKILQVNTADFGGGAESSALNLFRMYQKWGHSSWLAVGYKYSADQNIVVIPNHSSKNRWTKWWLSMSKIIEPLQDKIYGISRLHDILHLVAEPIRFIGYRYGYEDFYFSGTRHLLSLIPQVPDIIHCHNLHGGYFDLRILPRLSQRIPVILNLRDAWLVSGHCAHSFDCQRWKIGCGYCPYLATYPAISYDGTAYNWKRKRNIYKRSRLYIATSSQWLMNKVKMSMLEGVQYRIIPNAIDLTIFSPGSQEQARHILGLPKESKIVLLIAHSQFKDYETMETALARLKKNNNTKLIFVCLGKKGIDKVLGTGYMIYREFEISQKLLVQYYRAANIFIHAAKDEAFGKTITESMACGIPVVATAVGGIPEQISDGITGFLTPPHNAEAMTVRIEQLLSDSVLCRRLSIQAVKYAQDNFGLEHQARTFLQWYNEILEKEKIVCQNRRVT